MHDLQIRIDATLSQRELVFRHSATSAVQAACRSRKQRHFYRRSLAASTIQAAFRGRRVRNFFQQNSGLLQNIFPDFQDRQDCLELRIFSETDSISEKEATLGYIEVSNFSDVVHSKGYGVSLIVLADTSGSMSSGSRMENLRNGVVRLTKLASSYVESLRPNLTLIKFTSDSQLLYGPAPIPTEDEIQNLCSSLCANGGTDIAKAMEAAIEVSGKEIAEGRAVHVILFTDGEDNDFSRKLLDFKKPESWSFFNVLERFLSEKDSSTFLETLASIPLLWIHCVGICAEADDAVLNRISRVARRGTFQKVKDNSIAELVGSLWGLVVELVDTNASVHVEFYKGDPDSSGTQSLVEEMNRQVAVRLCNPPAPCRVAFHIPVGTSEIRASIDFFGRNTAKSDEAEGRARAIKRLENAGRLDLLNLQCIVQEASRILDHAFCRAADLLDSKSGDPESVMKTAMQDLEKLLLKLDQNSPSEEQSQVSKYLRDSRECIESGLESGDVKVWILSRASIARNNGVSIDPVGGKFAQSKLQMWHKEHVEPPEPLLKKGD